MAGATVKSVELSADHRLVAVREDHRAPLKPHAHGRVKPRENSGLSALVAIALCLLLISATLAALFAMEKLKPTDAGSNGLGEGDGNALLDNPIGLDATFREQCSTAMKDAVETYKSNNGKRIWT